MCDQGHKLIFNSKECEKREEGLYRLVATTTRNPNNIYILNEIGKESCCLGKKYESPRNPNNIYILNEIGKESCCLGKKYESWIWHKKMRHIHFDNLVNISKRQSIRDMPDITKLDNVVCKHC